MVAGGVLERFDLTGRTAIVTGGHTGIGAAIARGLASAGANVVIADVCTPAEADGAIRAIEETGHPGAFVRCDVSDRASVEACMEQTVLRFGRLDILVNNAAIAARATALQSGGSNWNNVLDVDLTGLLFACQAAARRMIPARYGRIINLASYWAIRGCPGALSYSVAKAGVISLTATLAVEWGKHNITVNAIAPGYVKTKMTEWVWKDREILEHITARIPLGNRLAEPDEVEGLVLFLASDASAYVTGTVIPFDGGLSAEGGSRIEWFYDEAGNPRDRSSQRIGSDSSHCPC
jgi:2-deoxy-D-gluconate 3-dehydrogenase